MKHLNKMIFLGFFLSLPALGQDLSLNPTSADHIINSSINAFVPAGGRSTLGFIVLPSDPGEDVDVVILAEGEGDFDPTVNVYFDSLGGTIVAGNDDWEFGNVNDLPGDSATANARDCFEDIFGPRLGPLDAMVLVSVTVPQGISRSVFAEVEEFSGEAGQVNLQLLQVDGPLAQTCPDF